MSKVNMSVRARHKLDTISLIHDVAKKLALTHGLADTKIEDIASAAGISRRTFFNYFPTKEDAVLGLQPPILTDEAVQRFANSQEDLIASVVWLTVEVMRTTTVPGSSVANRKELRKRFPELIQRFEFRAAAAEKIIRPVVINFLSQGTTSVDEQEVSVILNLAGAIIRYTYRVDPEFKDASITQSLQVFKKTIRKIT